MSPRVMDPPSAAPAPAAVGSAEPGRDPVEIALRHSGVVVEIHLCARPQDVTGGFETQARSMYENLLEGLRACEATPEDLIAERLFLSDVGGQAPCLARLRSELHAGRGRAPWPAASLVQQPPARSGQLCELQALALRPGAGTWLPRRALDGTPGRGEGIVVEIGRLRHVFLAGAAGAADRTGGAAEDGLRFQSEATAMFRDAEEALRREGLTFRDVARTWIFVTDIDRDYAGLNRARRDFLTARGIHPPPASTGIQGVPFPPSRACSLDLRAIGGSGRLRLVPFGSPEMNEAPAYGADFSRGMRVEMEDRTVLYVSGTASIDAAGRVVAPGDIDGQVERMLSNVESLLSGQGTGWDDVVSQITYLKRPAHAESFRRAASRRGPPHGTPVTVCVADVCRPEWLCETEVTAVLR